MMNNGENKYLSTCLTALLGGVKGFKMHLRTLTNFPSCSSRGKCYLEVKQYLKICTRLNFIIFGWKHLKM